MYKQNTFAIDKTRPVITAKYPYRQCQPVLGEAKQASEIDWLKVNLLYRCPSCRVMLRKFQLKRIYWERNPRPFIAPVKQKSGVPGVPGGVPTQPGVPPDMATVSQIRRLTKEARRKLRREKKMRRGHARRERMHAGGTLAKGHRFGHHPGKKGKHGAGGSMGFEGKGRGKKGGAGMPTAKKHQGNKKKRARNPRAMKKKKH